MPTAYEQMRKHERFAPVKMSFVVFMSDDKGSRLGTIKDIGKGGIGYSYLTRTDKERPIKNRHQKVALFVSGKPITLSGIPCKHVYKKPDDENSLSFLSNLTTRCGLEFDQLSTEQEKQIDQFLEKYTVRSA